MREIGGYIELDSYCGEMLYDDAIKLNCGRNALAYVVKAKKIRKIWMPKFMCDSCKKVLRENCVEVYYYSTNFEFKPVDIKRCVDEWIYLVNYYGQYSNAYMSSFGEKVIIDNTQAYFQEPIRGIDTLYSCRKFFGVPDGAILFTDKRIEIPLVDESYNRMNYLLGRYERDASEFFDQYVANNSFFENEPIKRMSRLTENLLHGIAYNDVKKRRNDNFRFLHDRLFKVNRLALDVPEGAFMYPFYVENGNEVRKRLLDDKIYIPTLWPDVFKICDETEIEYIMAKNILPLPIDQRYTSEDMRYLFEKILKYV